MTPGLQGLRLAWREGGLRWPVGVAVAALALSALWAPHGHGAEACAAHMHAGHAGAAAQCPSSVMRGWMLMVAAMMPPLLVPAINHVLRSSFRDRRVDTVLSFALGYVAVWGAASIPLVPVLAIVGRFLPGWSGCLVLLGVAIAWGSSPLAQFARNRCHRLRGINPFGLAADRDAFLQGLTTGVPCVLACWPWMLVPMSAPANGLALMALVTIFLFLESLAPPKPPSWQSPPAIRMLGLVVRR